MPRRRWEFNPWAGKVPWRRDGSPLRSLQAKYSCLENPQTGEAGGLWSTGLRKSQAHSATEQQQEPLLLGVFISHMSVAVKSLLKPFAHFHWTLFTLLRSENPLHIPDKTLCRKCDLQVSSATLSLSSCPLERLFHRAEVCVLTPPCSRDSLSLRTPALGQQHVVLMAVGLEQVSVSG